MELPVGLCSVVATMELPVGLCGIVKLTIQIISRHLKHFLCITFMLILPFAVPLALTPSRTSIGQIMIAQTVSHYPSHEDIPSPTQPPPYPLFIVIFVVSVLSHLVAQPTLTFSACRAVFNKSLAYERSFLSVPLSALNLILTELCVVGMLLLGLGVGMLILMIIMAAGLSTMSIDRTIVMMIWGVVMAGGTMYVGIACSLASTVAILEEKRGWEAVKRSVYLLDGSKWVAFSLLALVFGVVFGVCLIFLPISASDEASLIWRWSCVVSSFVELLSGTSMVVLYISCRSHLKEPLVTLVALNPQFGPLETLAKDMDIESGRVSCAVLY